MNVAIYVYHTAEGYSGGRLSAMTLAVSLAKKYNVSYVTNVLPRFVEDYVGYADFERINFSVCQSFECESKVRFDIVVVVPDGCFKYFYFKDFYLKAIRRAYLDGAKILMVNFETPNWFNSVSEFKKDERQWKHWLKTSYYSDGILSLARIGTNFAREFYTNNNDLAYYDCHLAINQLVADQAKVQTEKSNQIIVFCRFSNPHKGNFSLLDIFSNTVYGYTIKIVVGAGIIPNEFDLMVQEKAKIYDIKVVYLVRISELDKYKEIARSRILLFLSDFEGYGLPPVEALYMGVPVVAKYLDVLFEVSGNRIFYIEKSSDFRDLDIDKISRMDVSHSPQIEINKYSIDLFAIFDDLNRRQINRQFKSLLLGVETAWLNAFFYLVGRHLEAVLGKSRAVGRVIQRVGGLLLRISSRDFWSTLLSCKLYKERRSNKLISASRVAVYGIGDHALTWSDWCIRNNKKIICYIHSNISSGRIFNGKPVISQDRLPEFDCDIVVLATVSALSALSMSENLIGMEKVCLFFARDREILKQDFCFDYVVSESFKLIDLNIL